MKRMLAVGCMVLLVTALGCNTTPKKGDSVVAKQQENKTMSGAFEENPNLKRKEFDLNGDSTPDMYKYYDAQGVLVRKEADLNNDGKVDIWIEYDPTGAKEKEAFDLDFDGRIDLIEYYKNNALVRKEIDFQFDERPDIWKYYMDGRMVRKEVDSDHNGKPDYWEFYNDKGEISRIGRDLDGDGQIDVEEKPERAKAMPQEENMEEKADETKAKVDQGSTTPEPDPEAEPDTE